MSSRSGAGSRADVVQQVFGNQRLLDSFLASRQVTVQRLHLRRRDEQKENPGILSSYNHDEPIKVPDAQFREIQQLLQKPSSYDWRYSKACIVDYGMVFTFRNG